AEGFTILGVSRSTSMVMAPPSPMRFIHSRSRCTPSMLTFPFIQCQNTRGLALAGGSAKPARNRSAVCASPTAEVKAADKRKETITRTYLCAVKEKEIRSRKPPARKIQIIDKLLKLKKAAKLWSCASP